MSNLIGHVAEDGANMFANQPKNVKLRVCKVYAHVASAFGRYLSNAHRLSNHCHHKLYIWLQRRPAERLVIMSIRHVFSAAEAIYVDLQATKYMHACICVAAALT